MMNSPTASSAADFVRVGVTWSPGARYGVQVGVARAGVGADGKEATELSLIPTQGRGGWESRWQLREGELLPCAHGALRVVAIRSADPNASNVPGSPGHGGVTLEAVGGASDSAPPLVYLAERARLTLADADPMKQMVVRVQSWLPDSVRPDGAVITWVPQPLSFGNGSPTDVLRATVRAGSAITVGSVRMVVNALVPPAPDHPAWIGFEVVSAS